MISAPTRKPGRAAEKTPTAAAVRPTKHLVFDLETADPSEDAIEVASQFVDAPGNVKDPVKIEENLAKQRAQIRTKAALLDAAPIACMTWVTEHERVLFFHTGAPWGKFKVPKQLKGLPDIQLKVYADERAMLIGAREWLDERAIVDRDLENEIYPSILGGHNVKGFDLPHLRFAYLRHRLTAPAVLWPEALRAGVEVFDTMTSFLYDYSSWFRGDKFIKLEVVSGLMGLPAYKQRMSGADVPAYVKAGRFEEVAIYNVLDALQTYRIFLGQTNQGGDQ